METAAREATREPGRGRRRVRVAWLAALTLGCVAAALWLRHEAAGGGDGYAFYGQWVGRTAPDFALTDQDGRELWLSGLRGKLVLMTFGFTHCPNICPTTLAHLAAICKGLGPGEQERVRVLFVTVDPARDTSAVIRDYVRFYSPGFLGATGPETAIAAVAKAYGAYYEAVLQESRVASNYYTINHSAYVYLIDPAGRFAVLYDNEKLADHARMQGDIRHILEAPPQAAQ